MTQSPLEDPLVQNAITAIRLRSEREPSSELLEATFVDPGISARLANTNNQILYGRRGTGKTHVLKVLERSAHKPDRGYIALYVDFGKLGSGGMHERRQEPTHLRALALFKDLLAEVNNQLLDFATDPAVIPPGLVFERINQFSDAFTRHVLATRNIASEVSETSRKADSASSGATVSAAPSAKFGSTREATNERTTSEAASGTEQPHIAFQELSNGLTAVLDAAGIRRFTLLIDEWVHIPYEVQPLVAEYIKRCFFGEPRVVVKIGAIEYRSHFGEPLDHNNTLGFELGADIHSAVELDDYFVYDRDPERTVGMFAKLLFRHVAADIERYALEAELSSYGLEDRLIEHQLSRVLLRLRTSQRYITFQHDIVTEDDFVHAFFVGDNVFVELVRAGEGVVRDFFNIFTHAYFDALRRHISKIDMAAVSDAAREWYERDKAINVSLSQRVVLQRIVTEVIGSKRLRTFLLKKEYERDEMIRSLFDFRLLHLVHRGHSDECDPGVRYNIYAIDYGAYVDLLNTPRAPERDLLVRDAQRVGGDEVVVPFNDRRAMRRVVLSPAVLAAE